MRDIADILVQEWDLLATVTFCVIVASGALFLGLVTAIEVIHDRRIRSMMDVYKRRNWR